MIAVLVVLLVCGFVAMSVIDGCGDEGACPPDCQLACAHGCGAQAVFVSDRALVGPAQWIGEAGSTIQLPLASRTLEPEPQPPRA